MIVKNQQEIIDRASDLVSELLLHAGKYFLNFKAENDDDPAGYIYMAIHMLAMMNVRMGMTISEYSKIYGIEGMDVESVRKWIDTVSGEYLKIITEKKPPQS